MRTLRLEKLSEIRKESQEQKIVTKNFGQRVDFYSHFNLYNDTKSSVYFEQKGRTVGDVDFAPGSTISGCLTNTDFVIYFTNLNGGKDSITVTSNQLRMAVPSAKVKPGELDPTLNLSSFSMSKFAGMRKVANFTRQEIDQFATWLTPLRKKNGDRYYDIAVAEVSNNIAAAIMQEVMINPLGASESNFKDYFRAYISFYLLSTVQSPFPIKAIRKDMNFVGNEKDLEESQKNLESLIVVARGDLPNPAEWNKKNPPNRPSGGGGGSSQAAIKINHPQDTKLADKDYEYEVTDPSNTFEWKQISTGKLGIFDRNAVGNQKWNQAAARLNTLTPASSPAAATQSAATGTTPATTPATGTPAAEAPNAGGVRQLNQVTVACVRAVLQKASEKALALFTGENERGRIRDLASSIQRYGGVYASNPLSTLAQMVVAKNEQYLNSVFPQDVSGQIYQASKADLKISGKGKFSGAVAAVLAVMNQIFNEYVENKEGYITAFVSNQQTLRGAASSVAPAGNAATAPQTAAGTPAAPATNAAPATPPATPPANPAPAAQQTGNADDGMTKKKSSQSIDARIKKLATLRRLRVRSQMEAAVEASSMFGRSRVS